MKQNIDKYLSLQKELESTYGEGYPLEFELDAFWRNYYDESIEFADEPELLDPWSAEVYCGGDIHDVYGFTSILLCNDNNEKYRLILNNDKKLKNEDISL